MVYESDFYTTRRPYSSSRPYVSSYSVTPMRGPFYLFDPYSLYHSSRTLPHMPYAAHRRLVKIVHAPVRIYHSGTYLPVKLHARVRPSIIAAELNRIRYLHRPSTQSYTEHYLNSKDYIDFDDETREIRAKTDNLLRRIHVFVPRPSISDYDETSPEKLRSDDYIRRIINARTSRKDIESLPWYTTPEKRDIGEGRLACIKYAGGRPQSKRRSYYTVGDLVPGDVKTDVKLMSYYMKNRKAAEDALPPSVHEQHTHTVKETQNAPASTTVRWADETVREEETAEQARVAAAEPVAAEATTKPRRKKEKELKAPESADEPMEADAEYDENGVKKQPDDDTIKRVQEYLEKKAAEKKMEEERRAWEESERKRIIAEKELARLAKLKLEEDARLAEIKEQERLEAERQAVIRKAEEARLEAERLVEDEKLFKEALAQAIADEEERIAKEREQEELNKMTEDEEKAENLSPGNDVGDLLGVENSLHSEEHSVHADLSDQEVESKPYEVDHDEDTQIEEDVHEEQEDLENPFAVGETSAPEVDEPVTDAPVIRQRSGAGGEQGFDWSEYDDELEADKACVEAQLPQVDEEAATAGDQQQVFEESEVESQAETAEARVEESEVAEEVRTEEVEVTEEAQEEDAQEADEVENREERTTEQADEEAEQAEQDEVQNKEEVDDEAQVTEEEQTEEVKSEAKYVEASEEETEEEEEEEE